MNQTICVSAIIPCFERTKELQRLLVSLKKLDISKPWEIIVVDDGSKNYQAIKTVVDEFRCSLIRLDNNLGPAEAKNIGVKKAKGKFLWFLDSDTEINNPHLLTTLVQCLKQNKSLIGVGGEAIKINGRAYAILSHHFPNWLFSTKYVPINKSFEVHPKCIATNNLLVSKKDFLSTTGFSSYFDTYEDNDLCLQLTRSGKSLLTRNDTCIIHHRSTSGRIGSKFHFYDKMKNYVFVVHINRVKILFKNFPYRLPVLPLLDIIFSPIVLLSQIFFTKKRSTDVFQEKSQEKLKSPSRSFIIFVFFNLIAMFLAWYTAGILMIKSLMVGRKTILKKK